MTRPVIRARRRGPVPLEQIPAWGDLAPVMDPSAATPGLPEGMDDLLGGLDPDQLRAVTHEDGPLLVVAGAGTGKTQVITRRIAWLIATRRARPSEILALTFTDKAADEMAVRVDQLVPYGYTDTAIATFHAFGDRLIREHALELGLPPDVRVLSRAEAVIFLREHLFEFDLDTYRPLGDPTRFLSALVTLFSRCKDEDITPATLAGHAALVGAEAAALAAAAGTDGADVETADALAEDGRRQAELARAYARYQELLAANGFIDFGDQVALALRLVRRSPATRRAIASATSTCWSTSSRTPTERRPSSSRCSRNRTGTSRSSATTTRRSTRSAAPRSTTSSSSRRATRAPGPWCCDGTTGRSGRSSTRPTGWSGSTTPTGSRCVPV